MKPFHDDDLIAYHLHELSPSRARALERALRTDPALATESEMYAATLRALKEDTPVTVNEEVLTRNWKAIQPSLAAYRARPVMRPRWHLPALAAGGLAFAGTLFFVAMHHHHAAPASLASAIQPEGIRQPNPLAGNSLAGSGSRSEDEARSSTRERGSSFSSPALTNDGGNALRPRVSYLSLATEPSTVPHLIPLASLSLPALPFLPAPPGAVPPGELVQTASSSNPLTAKRIRPAGHHQHPAELTFAMGGTLIGTREASDTGTVERFEGATHAISAVAAFHQQLRPAIGYRIAFSYSRPEFASTMHSSMRSESSFYVNSRIYEAAATYVVQGPHYKALSTSADVGAGLMRFSPTIPSTETSSQMRGAAVVGVSAEIAVTRYLAVHIGYRGQAFTGPDFKYNGPDGTFATTTLVSNEPTVGITYRFSHK